MSTYFFAVPNKSLNDWSPGKQFILFPSNLVRPSRNLMNCLPVEQVIKFFLKLTQKLRYVSVLRAKRTCYTVWCLGATDSLPVSQLILRHHIQRNSIEVYDRSNTRNMKTTFIYIHVKVLTENEFMMWLVDVLTRYASSVHYLWPTFSRGEFVCQGEITPYVCQSVHREGNWVRGKWKG